MNTQPLTDERIRAAMTHRATSGVEGDLRDRVRVATVGVSQRRGWPGIAAPGLLPQRQATLRLALAVALLLAAALIVFLIGNRSNPALGRLAFISNGDLYVTDADAGAPRLIWDLPSTTTEDTTVDLWWLDKETVLLHTWIAPVDGVSVVSVVSGAHRLLDTGDVVALSPDRRVVAVHAADLRVRLIEIATGAVVGDFPGMARGYPATWSPDGRFLLSESPGTIDRTDVATGEIMILASGLCCGLSEHWPTWSPDGTHVVYVDYHVDVEEADCRGRCGTLWTVPALGGAPTRITAELGSEVLPAFSPDGRWIAYIEVCPCPDTGRLVTNRLTIVAADGSGARTLAPDPRLRATADPDGQWITPGLGSVPGGRFTWDADSAGITYITKDSTLFHVTLDGTLTELEGSAITEFARQVMP